MREPRTSQNWQAFCWTALTWLLLCGLGLAAIALERPTGSLRGVVLDERGQPLARARVVAVGAVTRTRRSDAHGRYEFLHLPTGEFYVSAKAAGHEPQYQEQTMLVQEGKTLDHVDFKLSRTEPSLSVSNVQRVFLPGKPVRVMARGNQFRRLEVELLRLDLARLAATRPGLSSLRSALDVDRLKRLGVLQTQRTWSLPVAREHFEDEDWFHQPVQLPVEQPGAYVVLVGGVPVPDPEGKPRAAIQDSWWFTVSRTALVTKRSADALLAWCVDLESKQPLAGAGVQLFTAQGRANAGVTNGQGLVSLRIPAGAERVTLLADHAGAPALVEAGFWGDQRTLEAFAFTDRPVYRRGQTVFLKGVLRKRIAQGFEPLRGGTVEVNWQDARGEDLGQTRAVLSDASGFDTAFSLPEEAALGEYRARVRVGESEEWVSFVVADYRKPEFKLEILPRQVRWIGGQTAEVDLRTTYYFGAPVAGARLQTTVYSAPAYPSYDEETGFFARFLQDEADPVWGLGDVVLQQDLQADAGGQAALSIPLPQAGEGAAGDRLFTVVTEALDGSGRPVKSQASFRVVQSDVRLRVHAEQGLYVGGQKVRIRVETTSHEGRPLTRPVTTRLYRLESEERVSPQGDSYFETRRVSVQQGQVTTDARGLAWLELASPGMGSYELEAEVSDAQGRHSHDVAGVWVAAAAETPSSYRYGGLQIRLDKAVYRPGDTARGMVICPEPGATVLLTLEGRTVMAPRLIKLNGTIGLFELPVESAHKPNVHLAATVVNGLEFLTAERSLNVLPEDKFLAVTVSADPAKARPGDTVTYTVETRDWKGRPVEAEVALGVVDEAIYAIEPDRTPDIRSFFHGPRWNQVETAYSFAEDYSGGLDKFAPDPRVRAQFKDTAAWYPSLRTGRSGRAAVRVRLPDNLTTWVATARAATLDTRVGTARHRLLATQDLLVRLEGPRFAVVGDEVVLAAIAHNQTGREQRIALRIEVDGVAPPSPGEETLALPPGGTGRVTRRIEVPAVSALTCRALARPLVGTVQGDAMAQDIPVRPDGIEDFLPVALEATTATPATVALSLPSDALPGAQLEAQLQASPLSALRTGSEYLWRYPYACSEQTSARLVPDLVVGPALAKTGLPPATWRSWQPEGDAQTTKMLAALLSLQQPDGGWGWWRQDISRPELTSHVMLILAEARRMGLPLPPAQIRRALERMRADLAQTGRDATERDRVHHGEGPELRAQIVLALTRWGEPQPEAQRRLRTELTQLGPRAQAQLVLSLLDTGGPAAAREVLTELTRTVDETTTYAHWNPREEASAWRASAPEATAWGLRAVLAADPDAPLVGKLARWLLSRNAEGHWGDTRASTAALWALAEYWPIARADAGDGGVGTLALDGHAVHTWEVTDPQRPVETPRIRQPLTPGEHTLEWVVAGPRPLTWAVSGGIRLQRPAQAWRAASRRGLSVERRYLRLPADVAARVQGKGWAACYDDALADRLPLWRGDVRAGERILVRLTLRAEKPVRWMCLRDPIPAGCEILEDLPTDWRYWWTHQEARDDAAVFFFSELPAGERSVYYVTRPTTPGRFRALPAALWAMYDQELRAWSDAQTASIVE
ncbi:MAG: MG2 domain-containing protein [Candidatus Sericytochromatia bacterium]|nr:MG2 domain-containing protein [Candidatus Sericytochromatia bacterium]